MKSNWSRLFFVVFYLLVLTGASASRVSEGSPLIKQINETIANIQSEKTIDLRTEAAEHLADLTLRIKQSEVTEILVTKLTSLLESPDDSVRYWVAIAIGNIGVAAKSAVPKLQEMLPAADCINGAITSSSGIRYALIKIGIKPLPPHKCDPISG